MSEYQYYKFERLDGFLDAKERQALRAISSRAEISATSFQVYYTYSDLKAEPSELMLKYFDIGFYYADWGSIYTYIKLPAGTLPDALLGFSSDGLYVHQSDEWQLLFFPSRSTTNILMMNMLTTFSSIYLLYAMG